MKLAAFLLLFTLTPLAWAGDLCRSQHLGLITVSKHISPARDYNEKHWGPYWRCQMSEHWSGQLGWYSNSYNRSTVYGLLNYVPWRMEVRGWELKLGAAAGVGTGYAEHSDGRPKGGLSPIFGGLAAVEVAEGAHVGVFFNTAVVALIVEVKWK